MWETKYFKTFIAQHKWIENNNNKYTIIAIFINNGFAVEFKKLRKM